MEVFKLLLKKLGLYGLVVKLYDYAVLQLNTVKVILSIIFKHNPGNTFLFFPYYHTGGAEKVHLDIAHAISSSKPWIFFTNPSSDNFLLSEFEKTGVTFDLSNFLKRNYTLGTLLKKSIIWKINRSPNSISFGGNCLFYYSLIPQFNQNVHCIDLIHAFVHKGEDGAEYSSLPVAARLNKRITINSKTKKDFKWLYSENGLPDTLNEKVFVIQNMVFVPQHFQPKPPLDQINIAFVSRNSPEKRVHLVGRIAQKLSTSCPCNFYLIGPDLIDGIEPENRLACQFLGNISNESELFNWYDKIHILILCSSREGMPMVIMEAMAHSAVCISTNVGGISDHIQHEINGYLINSQNEDEIITEFVQTITKIANAPELFNQLSMASYNYAKTHFIKEVFEQSWCKVLSK
ncbi:MAG: glycosyltransferase [Bacteroidia bacterium]|nr:glycosyltransferase [Bacteroidia bacterium]